MFDDRSAGELRRLLSGRPAIHIDAPQFKRAAVLIPLIRNGGRWSILFTRRSENLAAHSGQIAFPGGAVEGSELLEQAAIREAEEEVGIGGAGVELIGRLDDLITNSGFLVAPFAGIVHQPIEYVLQESEVVEVFEVPIDALLHPAQPEVRYVSFRGGRYPAYYYVHEGHEIWGLTGRMLKAFLDLAWQSV
ncbi:MAG TPA: CoA pyrophosphatase [Thermoanaerobaculia bacterium]|nr:CoA pyrophosphatase [Thermoanaerobaculia bacterium]